MKKQLGLILSLSLFAGTALAADLPSRKEDVVTPPPPMWTGFYAGLNAGYGFGTANNAQNSGWGNPNSYYANASVDSAAFAGANSFLGRNVTQGGFIGGGQIGYNHQYGQSLVIGFEADIQGAGISGQGNSSGMAPYDADGFYVSHAPIQAGINWMGTARGRVGYLIAPTVLTFVTGGLAYGGTYLKTFPTTYDVDVDAASAAGTYIWTQNAQQNFNVGWTAGGGFEWMMATNWSIKGEAFYYDLGNTSSSNTAYIPQADAVPYNPIGGSTTRAYYQGVIARAGVNYHFSLGSMPVITKF